MFMVALLTLAPTCEQIEMSTNSKMNKLVWFYIMEYYTTMKMSNCYIEQQGLNLTEKNRNHTVWFDLYLIWRQANKMHLYRGQVMITFGEGRRLEVMVKRTPRGTVFWVMVNSWSGWGLQGVVLLFDISSSCRLVIYALSCVCYMSIKMFKICSMAETGCYGNTKEGHITLSDELLRMEWRRRRNQNTEAH